MSEEDIFNSNYSSNSQEVPNLDYLDSFSFNSEIKIKLGDIIQIDSPNNDKYNLNVFFIEYIDDEIIKLIDILYPDEKRPPSHFFENLELSIFVFLFTDIFEFFL